MEDLYKISKAKCLKVIYQSKTMKVIYVSYCPFDFPEMTAKNKALRVSYQIKEIRHLNTMKTAMLYTHG